MSHPRYRAEDLAVFRHASLHPLGLPEDRARDTAEILVESDLLGHTTHGLGMAPRYLSNLDEGGMAREGDPETVADHGAASCGTAATCPDPGSCGARSRSRANGCARIRWSR